MKLVEFKNLKHEERIVAVRQSENHIKNLMLSRTLPSKDLDGISGRVKFHTPDGMCIMPVVCKNDLIAYDQEGTPITRPVTASKKKKKKKKRR